MTNSNLFRISETKLGPYTQLEFSNSDNSSSFRVIPDLGGSIHGLKLYANDQSFETIDGCCSMDDVLLTGIPFYKGSKLFPFPNRVKEGKYSFQGNVFQLPNAKEIHGHALHELLCEEKFVMDYERTNLNEGKLALHYSYGGEHAHYPFPYKLLIIYELTSESKFSCTTTVFNTGQHDLLFGDGWHPYFQLGITLDGLEIEIPASEMIELDETMIPTGKLVPNELLNGRTKLKGLALDHGFKLKLADTSSISTTKIYQPNENLTLEIWQESGFQKYNFLQMYTLPNRKSIAIEPMTCAPDAINNGMGLITLHAQQEISFTFGVRLTHNVPFV